MDMNTIESSKCSSEKISIINNKKAKAAVVVADNPSNVAVYAAKEFVEHVHKATGVTLSVISEADVGAKIKYNHYVYIGVTKTALEKGICVDGLKTNNFVIKTIENDLFVLGSEAEDIQGLIEKAKHGNYGQTFDKFFRNDEYDGRYILEQVCSWQGTLHGVYEILDRYLKVRWLWSGELGTYIPKTDNFTIEPIDEIIEPKYQFTLFFNIFNTDLEIRELNKIFLTRHGVNNYNRPPVGHCFHLWWTKYGKEHPEWFMLNREGNRGPLVGRTVANMCLSSKELQDFIVNEYWDGGDILDLSEGDENEYCRCPECMAMDHPDANKIDLKYIWIDRVLSDRYLKFYKAIYEKAVKRNPNVKIGTFLYWQTYHAPIEDIKLNENFVGEFVPWMDKQMWFPMPEDALEHMKEQWLRWKETGMTMSFRPNYWHGGYVMPFLSMHQIGEFLKFTFKNGSKGYSGDSFLSDFEMKGPMRYVHMRHFKNPEMDIDEILNEYYSAFGPASHYIKEYYEYWENFSHKVVNSEAWPQFGFNQFPNLMNIYTPKVFEFADKILEKAIKTLCTEENSEFIDRVKSIQLGLEHAKLSLKFINTLDYGKVPLNDKDKFQIAKETYNELRSFRKAINSSKNGPFIDIAYTEYRERHLINMDKLDEDFENIKTTEKEPTPWSQWMFKKDPYNIGVEEKWFSNDSVTKEWIPIDVPQFWENAVGPYIGYAWYRTSFYVPESWQGFDVDLDFKGVDEEAWIYVNGNLVGEHTEVSTGEKASRIWNKPFVVKALPAALKYGQENTLAVRVHNSVDASGLIGTRNEHDIHQKYGTVCTKTGGIHKPVYGYMPHPEKPVSLPVR